ncbi:alpha/beta hydrolase family protein [Streptomonospora litoralis]|uniref:hypothetical protein n=1 Tax=Streptomonospora litoralis TaxID=2498135 RepID=UPI00103653AC|nr:hypothetical protein [Streptomonospora litoralis]
MAIDWLFGGMSRFLPEQWRRFRGAVPEAADGAEVAAYAARMEHADPGVRERAAQEWTRWEDAVVAHEAAGDPTAYSGRPTRDRLAFVRIASRYFAHAAWLEEGVLLARAHRLASVPGVLVHGRLDLSAPLETAWQLRRTWPGARLEVLDDAGHTGSTRMRARVVAALDGFADAAG